jgi:hypothetical protein
LAPAFEILGVRVVAAVVHGLHVAALELTVEVRAHVQQAADEALEHRLEIAEQRGGEFRRRVDARHPLPRLDRQDHRRAVGSRMPSRSASDTCRRSATSGL